MDAIGFIKTLKFHLEKQYFEDYYIGSIYSDVSTITYFPFTPRELKELKLKIAIVYNHRDNQLEIWLAGQNKNIQKQYWEMFKGSNWKKYHVPTSISDGFSIVDHILFKKLDFNDRNSLIETIESQSMKFIKDIKEVLVIK